MIYIKEIYSKDNDHLITIQVHGTLDSNSILILKSTCQRHSKRKQEIELDLRKVLHISREGREFLKKIQQEGVRIEYHDLMGIEEGDSKK